MFKLEIILVDQIEVSEELKLKSKDEKGKCLSKRMTRTKKSGKTKRSVVEELAIDNSKGTKYHCVKERSEDGKYSVVHEHLDKQGKK